MDQFEQLYADADAARVMALVVHPYIMGAPHRLRYFRDALHTCVSSPDVLFWTGEQILDWCLSRSVPRRRSEAHDSFRPLQPLRSRPRPAWPTRNPGRTGR